MTKTAGMWRLALGYRGRKAAWNFAAAILLLVASILVAPLRILFDERREALALYDAVDKKLAAGDDLIRFLPDLARGSGPTKVEMLGNGKHVVVVDTIPPGPEINLKFRRQFDGWTIDVTRSRPASAILNAPALAIAAVLFAAAILLAIAGIVRRRSYEVTTGILEFLADVIAVVNADASVAYITTSVEPRFGYSPEFVAGRAFTCFVEEDDRAAVAAMLARALQSEKPQFSEARIISAAGARHFVDIRAQRIRDGNVDRVLAIVHDVSEVTMLQQQVETARRLEAVGRATAVVAHEVRNILMTLQSTSNILRHRATQDDELRIVAEHLQRAVARGTRVVDDVLRFSKPAAPQRSPIVFHEWEREIAHELRAAAGPRITIDIHSATDVNVIGDRQQLAQVLLNVIINARDAMNGEGRIEWTIEHSRGGAFPFGIVSDGEFVWWRIRDEGPGIPRHVAEHVFEPLFTTKRAGTGLGLSVSYQIVQRHNGAIFIESEEARGATVHIFLPAELSPAEHLRARAAGA